MKFELLKEMVDSGYNSEDINELYEFCIDYILEYEHIIERSALKRQLNALKKAKGGTEKGTKLWSITLTGSEVLDQDSKDAVFYQLALSYNWLETKKEKMD